MSVRPAARSLGPEARRVVDSVRSAIDGLGRPSGPDRGPPSAAEHPVAPSSHALPTLVVALSGGLDSCVLLHVLRFALDRDVPLGAAHFDHRMRAGSARDAAWVRGLCRAWGVEVVGGEAGDPPTSEAEARDARYAFLESVRRRSAPARLLTAHHADDQAETVLFRVLRGTGIEGLAGIPGEREPAIVRPLLGVWREELEAYATEVGLRWREDATNELLGFARNVIRHELLPRAEETVAPGARRALVRLSEIAGAEGAAWSDALDVVLGALDVEHEPDRPTGPEEPTAHPSVSVDREGLAALSPGLRGRVIRRIVEMTARRAAAEGEAPHRLDAASTERAADFVREGRSGAGIELGGGIELRRELDRIVVATAASEPPPDREVAIGGPGSGTAEGRFGGQTSCVRWSVTRPDLAEGRSGGSFEWEAFPIDALAFPLHVRARRPGDRIEGSAGTRKVKKVMLEARIPPSERVRVPVLADAHDRVLWIPGVKRAAAPAARAPTAGLRASDGPKPPGGPALLWIGVGP